MLQQTRVDAVIPYYARFLARFPTLEALAAAPPDEVLRSGSGLGYYARARNLHAARERRSRGTAGSRPTPPRSARCPASGRTPPAPSRASRSARAPPPSDGNVARVLARLFLVDAPPAPRAARTRVAALADALVPADRPGDFNQALMDLGATVCTAGARSARAARSPRRARRAPPAASARSRRRACAPRRASSRSRAPSSEAGALLVARRKGRGSSAASGSCRARRSRRARTRRPRSEPRSPRAARRRTRRGARRVVRTLTHRRLTLRAVRCGLRGAPPAGHRFARPAGSPRSACPTAMRRIIEAAERRKPPRRRATRNG